MAAQNPRLVVGQSDAKRPLNPAGPDTKQRRTARPLLALN